MPPNTDDQRGSIAVSIARVVIGTASILSFAFLAFMLGGLIGIYDTGSGSILFRQTAMLIASFSSYDSSALPFGPLWGPAAYTADSPASIVTHDRQAAFQGFNLVLTSDTDEARLLTMDGEIAHQWAVPIAIIWANSPHISTAIEDTAVYLRRAHLFANGDILVIIESPIVTPYGLGMVKLDKDSKVIWILADNVHHDIAVDDNGRIYTFKQEISDRRYPAIPELVTRYLNDSVAIISPGGKLIKKVGIIDAFLNSRYATMLQQMAFSSLEGDLTHPNTVQYIDAALAARFPFAKPGQVLISVREMNTVAIMDIEREEIVWAMTGLWKRQHEPQLLDDGRMIVFDNLGRPGPAGASSIIELDPLSRSETWAYTGTADAPLSSPAYGTVQRLPNGNTLVVESTNGRVVEVSRDQRIVWEYRSPNRRHHEGRTFVPIVTDLVRFTADQLKFLPPSVIETDSVGTQTDSSSGDPK